MPFVSNLIQRMRFGARRGHSRWFPWLLGAAVAGTTLAATEFNDHLLQRELDARARADALGYASALRAGIERELNAVLYLSSGLASYLAVRRHSLDAPEVQAILVRLYRDGRHVRNFGVAIGHRLTYVYPEAGNEAALGLYYPDQPAQWPQVQRAIASSGGTLTGPLNLVQGGEGLIYRVPVRIQGSYWGLLSTVIDNRTLLAAAVADLADTRFQFAIRGRDGAGWGGAVFVGDSALFDAAAVTLEVKVPNGSWVLAVRPQAPSWVYPLLLRVMGWVLALLLGAIVIAFLRHRIELAELALVDPLTALRNRRYLEDHLTQRLARGARQRSCGLLFIDLDGFKAINDTFGHKAGDWLLRTVGQRVAALVRAQDVVARWGGDELVVLVEDASADDLAQLAERLREAIEQPVAYDGQRLAVGASIGHALPPRDGASARELLKVADQRMYAEKQRRRDGAG